jgi:hypothetical protein
VENEMKSLKITNYKIVIINKQTDGQATTVTKAMKFMKPMDSFVIYNIDTGIKPGVITEKSFSHDGTLTTAKAKGNH